MEIIVRGTNLKDRSGERIWFPKDGKAYFDQAARRVFKNPMEKKEWMDRNKVVSDGSSDYDYARKHKQIVESEKEREKKRDERRKNASK